MSRDGPHTMHRPPDRGHAVVVGAGMAGLCFARVLADTFDHVTVVDRDRLTGEARPRRGVPQGRHVHPLLPAGVEALERLFPGLGAELGDAGAHAIPTEQVRLCLNGYRLAPGRTARPEISASRPLLEAAVAARVRAHPCVELRDGVETLGLVADPGGRRVTGIRVRPRVEERAADTLDGDLVVDCSGRRSRAPAWLEELGYAPPPVERVDVDLRYATRRYRLPADVLDGDRHLLVGPMPDRAAGGVLLAVEDGVWLATLFGLRDVRPSMTSDDFAAFASRLAVPDLREALRVGTPLDAPAGYRFPAELRRRYDRLDALPAGLLVAGDAVSSFNPIYGQGMTIGALEALQLRELLTSGVPHPQRWYSTITPIVDVAWELAVGADLAIPSVPGRRTLATRLRQAYLRSFQAAACRDPRLTARFWRVAGLVDPPAELVRPAALARVARGRLRR